jgi:transcriptional regulator with XRE-family HTH domain
MTWSPSDIRCLRLRLGWSAAELGRRLGCSAQQVMNWECGDHHPDAEVFNQLSFLGTYVEQNAARTAQIPMAEDVMTREHLAQITNDMVAQAFRKN